MDLERTAEAWWSWMGPMLWQGTLIMVVVAIVDRLLARWLWPQVRLTLWLLVLVKLVLPPTTASPVAIPQVRELALAPSEVVTSVGITPWLFTLWAMGAVAIATVATLRVRRCRIWLQNNSTEVVSPSLHELLRAQAARLAMKRIPHLRVSAGIPTAAVVGAWRPTIVIPESLLLGRTRDLELAILHELAHVKRGDPWVSLSVLLLQVAYWFHPMVWWMRRRIGALNEICCDATVARVLDGTSDYRATLLRGARRLIEPDRVGGLGLTGGGNLLHRLDWLARDTWRWAPLRRLFNGTLAVAIVVFVLPMAAIDDGSIGLAELDPRVRAVEDSARAQLERAASGERTSCITLRYSAAALLARERDD